MLCLNVNLERFVSNRVGCKNYGLQLGGRSMVKLYRGLNVASYYAILFYRLVDRYLITLLVAVSGKTIHGLKVLASSKSISA